MTTIVTVLTEGFADWEIAMLSAVARSFYGVDTRFASPGGQPVTSSGGMVVHPGLTLETLDLDSLDALVICGGSIWQTPGAPDLADLLHRAHARGKVIGAICDATVAAAGTGLLDDIAHTSNGAGYLDRSGYGGRALYRDVPHAVVDRRIVTAASTAPVTFMAEILRALGLGDDNLTQYVGMLGAEYPGAA